MWQLLILVLAAAVGFHVEHDHDPARDQIIIFKERAKVPVGIMTTSAGAPIVRKDAKMSLNRRLLFNEYFLDSLTHLARERIPERVVHAKAAGAFGHFELTHDISHICSAKLFSTVGKKTPVAARFSAVVVESGGIDTSRDARGFAVKFYTEEGNFDIVGFNTPMYVYKDPLLFTAFVRSQKRNPATNLLDGNTFWDFLTLNPESLHIFLLIFADRGIPAGYRHMPGFGVHTYEVVNSYGVKHYVRFHFTPEQGVKSLSSEEGRKIAAVDPDYATRDLYKAIGNGDYPAWKVDIQILTLDDVKNAGFDVFDVTKILPLNKYPLKPVGRFILNRNPINYFAEIEQLALNPANLVPGILGGPDKVFEARRLAYRDAQNYRLGANFNKIPVNCPLHSSSVLTYNRDGFPPVLDNGKDVPNYYPNSFNGPEAYTDLRNLDVIEIVQDEPNNFKQITELYVNEFSKDERERLVENILYSLGPVAKFLQQRAVNYFKMIHPDLGYRVQEGLLTNRTTGIYHHHF